MIVINSAIFRMLKVIESDKVFICPSGTIFLRTAEGIGSDSFRQDNALPVGTFGIISNPLLDKGALHTAGNSVFLRTVRDEVETAFSTLKQQTDLKVCGICHAVPCDIGNHGLLVLLEGSGSIENGDMHVVNVRKVSHISPRGRRNGHGEIDIHGGTVGIHGIMLVYHGVEAGIHKLFGACDGHQGHAQNIENLFH